MFVAAIPPALLKLPPAYSAPAFQASASTSPFTPVPGTVQLTPSHLAKWLAATPPAEVKSPPTKMSPVSLTAIARTVLSTPPATENQLVPSHLAKFVMPLPDTSLN